MKLNIKKRSLAARIATFTLVLAGTGFGSYLLMPSRKVSVVQNSLSEEKHNYENTYVNQFVKKMTKVIEGGAESEEESWGMSATFEGLEVTWPSKSGLSMNDIKVEGLINLNMQSLQDLDVTIDLEADYNAKKLDLALGLVDNTFYLAVKDLKIKSSYSNTQEFVSVIEDLFLNPDNPNGLGLDFNVSDTISSLIGSLDLSSLSLDSFTITEEVVENDVFVDLLIMEGIELKLKLQKDTLALEELDLGTMKIGDVTIKGKLVCNTQPNLKVLGLDDPDYAGKKRTGFVEIINYVGWADRILNLLQTKKAGIKLSASLFNNTNESNSRIVAIDANLNVDAENVFDVKDIDLNNLLSETEEETKDAEEEGSFLDELLNDLKFDASFSFKGQEENEYANLSLAYFDKTGYLSFNEVDDSAVMRAKIDLDSVVELINKVPDIVSGFTSEDKDASEDAEGLFDFVTSSELVTAIKDGMYDGILGLIDELSSNEDSINIKLNLSTLGFGDNSTVELALNADDNAIENGNKVIEIKASNVELGNLLLNCSIETSAFSDAVINHVSAIKNQFDDLSFVNGIFDQVSTILNTKQAGFGLEGKVLDDAGLGFTFDGWGQFDYGAMYGFGSMAFYEYKTDASTVCAEHKIDIDVNNGGDDDAKKNMLFEYRDKLRGKFTVQTLKDIIDLVKKLINENDERFTKFIEPIKDMLLTGLIKEVLDSKDYIALAKCNFIKSIAQNSDGSAVVIVIGKEVMDLGNDLTIKLNLNLAKNKALDSIEILGLQVGGKNIDLKVSINDFNPNLKTPVDLNASFYDFSDIAILLEFGINTTKLNVYHLTAPIKITVAKIVNLSISLDFYIQVDGVSVKVYGKIPNIPWLSDFVSADLGSVKVSSEFVFEPDHNASGNDIGGYFHIARTEDHWINRDDATYYYRSTSKGFLDNIVVYLIRDMLNLKDSVVDEIGNIETEPVENSNYEDLFNENGFTYTHTETTDTWVLDLNLQAVTGVSALGSLKLTLNGKEVNGVGYFTTAQIELGVASVVTITGTITLENPNPEVTALPSNIIDRYNKIIGVYNNLDADSKASFDLNYLNRPTKDYRISVL